MTTPNNLKSDLNIILVIGSLWGFSEFVIGLGLQKCAAIYTGAIMTGLAFLWLSLAYSLTKRLLPLILILLVVLLFKMSDAIFLPVSISHGSILNPMFAFLTITIGFLIMIYVFKQGFSRNLGIRAITGATAALLAVSLFPLAGFVTGSPACMHPMVSIPVSIYTSPVAIVMAAMTVPLGYYLSGPIQLIISKRRQTAPIYLSYMWSPLFLICCLLVLTLIRII